MIFFWKGQRSHICGPDLDVFGVQTRLINHRCELGYDQYIIGISIGRYIGIGGYIGIARYGNPLSLSVSAET